MAQNAGSMAKYDEPFVELRPPLGGYNFGAGRQNALSAQKCQNLRAFGSGETRESPIRSVRTNCKFARLRIERLRCRRTARTSTKKQ